MTEESEKKHKSVPFSPKKFKKAILSDEDGINTLKQFLEMLENPECEQDVVLDLLKSEDDTGESVLIKLVDTKRVISETTVIFNFFNAILNRIDDDLGQYELWGLAFTKQLLYPSRIHCLKRGLSDSNKPNQIQSTLNLLTTMVTLSVDSAKEVMRNFPPNANLIGPLLLKINITEKMDVCTATIDFLISFLTHNNNELANQLMEQRGVLNGVFPVLKCVQASVIHNFLGALLSQVVSSRHKSLKVALFNNITLLEIMKLFRWNGPTVFISRNKSSTIKHLASDGVGEDELIEQRNKVRQLAQEIVLNQLCSNKGVTFHDPFCGTSERNHNHTVTNILPTAYAQISSPMTAEVIVQVLKRCPDQIYLFFDQLKQNLQPRLTSVWMAHMDLVRTVIASQDLVQIQSGLSPLLNPETTAKVILRVSTASLFKSAILKEMCHNSDLVMRHQALLYVETVLMQVVSIIDREDIISKLVSSSQMTVPDFRTLLWKRLSMMLPSFDDLCHCWVLATNSSDAVVDVKLFEHLQKLIDVLAIHHRLAGSSQHTVQFAEMWNSIEFLNLMLNADEAIDIQVRLSKLVINAGLGKSLLLQKVSGKNVVYVMLELIGKDLALPVRKLLSSLLEQLLLSTNCFDPDELKMILRLYLIQPMKLDSVHIYLHDVLVELVGNFQSVLNAVASLQEDDSDKIMVDDEVALMDIFDDLLKSDAQGGGTDCLDLKIPSSLKSYKACLSPLVFLSLKNLDSEASDNGAFVTSFLYDVLHCHDKPDTFCRALRRSQQKLPEDFSRYMKYFDSLAQDDTLTKLRGDTSVVVESKDVSTKIRYMFETRSPFLCDIEDDDTLVSSLSDEEAFIVFRQILCYIELLLQEQEDDEALFGRLCSISEKLIANLKGILPMTESFETCGIERRSTLLRRMESALTDSSYVKDAFLNWDFLTKRCLKKARIVSDFILNLARNVDGCTTNVIAACLTLHEKAAAFIHHALLYMSSGEGKSKLPRMARISLIHILEPFLPYLSLASIQQVVAILPIDALASTVSTSRSGLSDCGLLLSVILEHLARAGHKYKCQAIFGPNDALVVPGLSSGDVAQSLHVLLSSNRYFAFLVSKNYFEFVLNNLSLPIYGQLALLLLSSDPENIALFSDWLLRCGIPSNENGFHRLALFFLETVKGDVKRHFALDKTKRVTKMLTKHYWHLLCKTIYEVCDDDMDSQLKSGLLTTIVGLQLLDAQKLLNFCESSISADLRPLSLHVVLAVGQAFASVSNAALTVLGDHPVSRYVVLCLKLLSDWFVQELCSTNINRERCDLLIDAMVKELSVDQPLQELGEIVHREKLTQKIVKTILKVALKDRMNVKPLLLLVTLLNRLKRDNQASHFVAGSIFELLLGHSDFLPGLLSKAKEDQEWKERLLDLLVLLTSMDSSVCCAALIPMYLSAYGASLNPVDQKLLSLMYSCEAQGVSMHQYRPFLWGEAAVTHYSILKDLRHTLLKQPTTYDILSLLDPERLLNTAHNFPLHLKLAPDCSDSSGESTTYDHLYDPRFLLPLFSQLAAPESLLHCMKFIESNALAVVFGSLGSKEENMRAAGYHVIKSFYTHLEGARFQQSTVWLYLLDCLANGIQEKNCQLSNVITVFLIEITRLLLVPSTPILRPMASYLTIKPALDIYRVPNFYQMFHFVDRELHDLCRGWILGLLGHGLREPKDYNICNKYYVFKIIMSYYKSPLSSATSRSQILNVILSACKLGRVARNLFATKGLTPFLLSTLHDCDISDLEVILQILATTTAELLRHASSDGKSISAESVGSKEANILKDIMFLLIRSLERMSSRLPNNILHSGATTLASIIEWNQTADGRQHFPEKMLTTSCVKRIVDLFGQALEQPGWNPDHNMVSNLLDDNQVQTHPMCEKKIAVSVCSILTSWDCKSCVSSEEEMHKSSYSFFLPVCRLLLVLSLRSDDVVILSSVYRWIKRQVRQDQLGELVALLAGQDSNSDGQVCIVDQLLQTYGCMLLGDVTEVNVGNSSSSALVDNKRDGLKLLNKLFLLIKDKLKNCVDGAVTIKNGFLKALRSVEVTGTLKKLAKKMKSGADDEKDAAAVNMAKFFLELWLKKDVEIVFVAVEKFLMSSQPGTMTNQPCDSIDVASLKRSPHQELASNVKHKRRKLVHE